jgi:hypothetical protein
MAPTKVYVRNHEIDGHERIGLWENDGYCGRYTDRKGKDARREGLEALYSL